MLNRLSASEVFFFLRCTFTYCYSKFFQDKGIFILTYFLESSASFIDLKYFIYAVFLLLSSFFQYFKRLFLIIWVSLVSYLVELSFLLNSSVILELISNIELVICSMHKCILSPRTVQCLQSLSRVCSKSSLSSPKNASVDSLNCAEKALCNSSVARECLGGFPRLELLKSLRSL